MSIISSSYFKGGIHIPNSQDTAPNSNLLGNGKKLELFIEEYELDILIKCLGFTLYDEFSKQLDSSKPKGLKDNAPSKWEDLLNGKEYDLYGKKVVWRGLIFKNKDLNRSLIAYYVFCEYLNNDLQSYRGTGVQKENSKNSKSVSADPLYVASFRQFFKLTEFSHKNNGLRSLYDFIQDMNAISPGTYPDWQPERFYNINQFGI
jgi:hypothetical protein